MKKTKAYSMDVNGKVYRYIFWDWFSTLWNDSAGTLYGWVASAFENMEGIRHYLITFGGDVQKREGQIESTGMKKYFNEIVITPNDKREVFKALIQKHSIPTSEILVVGDSYERELAAAKDMGIDWLHVDDFVKVVEGKGW
jgi:FMN phosphatase YigB (HAD superfamily)